MKLEKIKYYSAALPEIYKYLSFVQIITKWFCQFSIIFAKFFSYSIFQGPILLLNKWWLSVAHQTCQDKLAEQLTTHVEADKTKKNFIF